MSLVGNGIKSKEAGKSSITTAFTNLLFWNKGNTVKRWFGEKGFCQQVQFFTGSPFFQKIQVEMPKKGSIWIELRFAFKKIALTVRLNGIQGYFFRGSLGIHCGNAAHCNLTLFFKSPFCELILMRSVFFPYFSRNFQFLISFWKQKDRDSSFHTNWN